MNRLCDELGVTKGSFYWHKGYTLSVAHVIDKTEGGPAEQLKDLLHMVVSEELGRFDYVMASLAAKNPSLEST